MGGGGSGRWPGYGWKRDIDRYRHVDVRRWARDRLLEPGRYFPWNWVTDDGERQASIGVRVDTDLVTFTYTVSGASMPSEDVVEHVQLDRTPCNFGGSRPWFLCPGVVDGKRCGRRVAILYIVGAYFLCRHCHDLAYQSQKEGRTERLMRRARTLRRRLGGSGSLDDPFPPKPARMHWQTYWKLCAEAREAEHTGMMQWAEDAMAWARKIKER